MPSKEETFSVHFKYPKGDWNIARYNEVRENFEYPLRALLKQHPKGLIIDALVDVAKGLDSDDAIIGVSEVKLRYMLEELNKVRICGCFHDGTFDEEHRTAVDNAVHILEEFVRSD